MLQKVTKVSSQNERCNLQESMYIEQHLKSKRGTKNCPEPRRKNPQGEEITRKREPGIKSQSSPSIAHVRHLYTEWWAGGSQALDYDDPGVKLANVPPPPPLTTRPTGRIIGTDL